VKEYTSPNVSVKYQANLERTKIEFAFVLGSRATWSFLFLSFFGSSKTKKKTVPVLSCSCSNNLLRSMPLHIKEIKGLTLQEDIHSCKKVVNPTLEYYKEYVLSLIQYHIQHCLHHSLYWTRQKQEKPTRTYYLEFCPRLLVNIETAAHLLSMLPGRDYGDCLAILYAMIRAMKHVLLEKRKEKLVRLKETKESIQLVRVQNIDF